MPHLNRPRVGTKKLYIKNPSLKFQWGIFVLEVL